MFVLCFVRSESDFKMSCDVSAYVAFSGKWDRVTFQIHVTSFSVTFSGKCVNVMSKMPYDVCVCVCCFV